MGRSGHGEQDETVLHSLQHFLTNLVLFEPILRPKTKVTPRYAVRSECGTSDNDLSECCLLLKDAY